MTSFSQPYFLPNIFASSTTPLANNCSVLAEILVRNPGKPEKGNELGQTGSVGWKGWHVAARLNEAWMVRLEVAATQL